MAIPATERRALADYSEQLREELRVEAEAEGDEVTLAEALTQRVLTILMEEGIVEEAIASSHEHPQRGVSVSGYGIEDGDTLNLFGTIHSNEVPPASIPPRAVERALDRALRFWTLCR